MVFSEFKWIYVLSGIFCSAFAQICMKRATLFEGQHLFWFLLLTGSTLCYLLSFVFYYFALKSFSLSTISPIMTVGVVLIVVLYGVLSGEAVSSKHAVGLMLGAISIFLILS